MTEVATNVTTETPATAAAGADRAQADAVAAALAAVETFEANEAATATETSGLDREALALAREAAGEEDPAATDDGEEVAAADGDKEEQGDADDAGEAEGEQIDPEYVPATAEDYELPTVEGFHWDDAQRAAAVPYLEALHEKGATQGQVAAVMERYAAQMAAIETRNREAVPKAEAELARLWGGEAAVKENVSTIRTFLNDPKRIDPELAKAIREARAPSGIKLVNIPQYADLMLRLAKGQTVAQLQPTRAAAQPKEDVVEKEMQDLNAAMHEDISAFQNRRWRGTEHTGSERLLELERQRDRAAQGDEVEAPPSARELEIGRIRDRDISEYWAKGLDAELMNLMRARTTKKS